MCQNTSRIKSLRCDSFKFRFIKHPKKTDLRWDLNAVRVEHSSSNSVLCAVHLAAFDPVLLAAWTRASYDSHVPNLKPCGSCSFQKEICGVVCIIRHLHHLLRSDIVCQCLRATDLHCSKKLGTTKLFEGNNMKQNATIMYETML